MKIAYGDLIGGISGDMFVGAMLDLGLSLTKLKSELKKIPTLRYTLTASKKTVHSIRATHFQVVCPDKESARSWKQIRRLIAGSSLRPKVKEAGIDIFSRLAEAEGKIHGVAPEKVHFHEIGATDSIVDIMAAADRRARTRYRRLSFFAHSLRSRPDPRSARAFADPRAGHAGTLKGHPGAGHRSR